MASKKVACGVCLLGGLEEAGRYAATETFSIWRVWGAKKKGMKMKIGGRRKCARLAF